MGASRGEVGVGEVGGAEQEARDGLRPAGGAVGAPALHEDLADAGHRGEERHGHAEHVEHVVGRGNARVGGVGEVGEVGEAGDGEL